MQCACGRPESSVCTCYTRLPCFTLWLKPTTGALLRTLTGTLDIGEAARATFLVLAERSCPCQWSSPTELQQYFCNVPTRSRHQIDQNDVRRGPPEKAFSDLLEAVGHIGAQGAMFDDTGAAA